MAERPAWTIMENCVQEKSFEFAWNGGFAISQKRKNILALHQSIYSVYQQKALEISTKSEAVLGQELSAFNLKFNGVYLECVFQGSKKFENAGPETICKGLLNQIHKKFINQQFFSLLASLLLALNGIYYK